MATPWGWEAEGSLRKTWYMALSDLAGRFCPRDSAAGLCLVLSEPGGTRLGQRFDTDCGQG